ncbi:LOW QUALITY PROTEIN: cilia- and flagella-associated protein 100-like [Gigantopelta aegis]|uniref:LOW QUALITY PROTEIN: cilia- and flagella-associated protein 100-like n=1 Tax=Gigantopelta aegis TaxID=1735272 RepID=UPI001B889048|nr:LOW QUALITY PROTEIN: cilia- and flagella-associated protein 100-like [Gigantopelta aegis]
MSGAATAVLTPPSQPRKTASPPQESERTSFSTSNPSSNSRESDSKNPFIMPPDHELFTLREKERKKFKEERAKERMLKVHEKSTYSSRVNAKMSSLRKTVITPDSSDSDIKGLDRASRLYEDTQFVLATIEVEISFHIEKEDLNSYLCKKREMFLMQYSLGVKRDEIQNLKRYQEEKKLESAETYLEQSAIMFDEFLKENDKNSVEAIKMAEAATKAKLEKVAEIKRLNTQIMAIKSEISRNEDQLNELKTYRQFMNELAPRGVLYFTDPMQLLEIFTELEEQNLSLIQNSQETDEALEEIRHNRQSTEQRLNHEVEILKQQLDELERNIQKEENKAYDLETKSKLFSFGEFKADDQEAMLLALNKKVADVFSKCIGVTDATASTLQMLTAIEGRMEELFKNWKVLPVDKVEAAEKAKEKERRLRLREQKLQEQRLHQEERLKRALERAQADPKKRTGRRLVYRSEPPVLKRKQRDSDDQREKEEEELQYYFS